MTETNDNPGRHTTSSVKLPSLLRMLLVMAAILVLSGGGCFTWRHYQRENEREEILEIILTAGVPNASDDDWCSFEHVGQTAPRSDSSWTVSLHRGEYDWYLFISQQRGESYFRIAPAPTHYDARETIGMVRSESGELAQHQWHYVMDIVSRLKSNKPTSVELIRSRFYATLPSDPK